MRPNPQSDDDEKKANNSGEGMEDARGGQGIPILHGMLAGGGGISAAYQFGSVQASTG